MDVEQVKTNHRLAAGAERSGVDIWTVVSTEGVNEPTN
jgi:hypothetical protein